MNKKYLFIYCILFSSLIGSNFISIVKGTTIFDRQIEIPNGTTKEIPFELISKEGGKIKIYINSSEFLRFTILSDEEYQKYKDGNPHSIIISEDHIYNLSKTYTLSVNGSYYIILYNYYPLNEVAIVDVKVEIFEQNNNSENLIEIILIILIVIIIAAVVILYVHFISRQKKILNEEKIINLLTALALEVAKRILEDSKNPFKAIVWFSAKEERLTEFDIVEIEGEYNTIQYNSL